VSARGAKIFLVLVVSTLLAGSAIAGVVENDPRDTVGIQRTIPLGLAGPAEYFLRNNTSPSCGEAPVRLGFGRSDDQPLAADTDGDDTDELTIFRSTSVPTAFFVRDSNAPGAASATRTGFGAPGDIGLAGNFDGADDDDEFGVYRPATRQFFLRADNGSVLDTFVLGAPGDLPVVGNWDGSADGSDEVGVFRPATNEFFLRASNGSIAFRSAMGAPGDLPIVGDWDRDGTDTIGVYRNGQVFLRNTNSPASGADVRFGFGGIGDTPFTGDFDGSATDENTGACSI